MKLNIKFYNCNIFYLLSNKYVFNYHWFHYNIIIISQCNAII